MVPSRATKSRKKNINLDRNLAILAIITIVIAWIVGGLITNPSIKPLLNQAFPDASRFESLNGATFAAWGESDEEEVQLGYVKIGEAIGYGGPMKVAVGMDHDGKIVGVSVVDHKETPSFLFRVFRVDFLERLDGMPFDSPFHLEDDVDAVSGATITSRAITEAVREASRGIASQQLGLSVPTEEPEPIQVGVPEIVLLALFGAGYVGHQRGFKHKTLVRWLSMIAGLFVAGFIYNNPLTLANINSLLLGYWPSWRTNLYWYLLIGGILFVFTVDNKNPYCEWFCPFGAAQECLGALGGAKPRTPREYRSMLVWIQRGLAWLAIVLGLLFRNPGLTSYEIFGMFFDFTGSEIQFVLLAIVLIASLFIRRPWCTYLCPLRPVVDLIRLIRNWVKELWQKGIRRVTKQTV